MLGQTPLTPLRKLYILSIRSHRSHRLMVEDLMDVPLLEDADRPVAPYPARFGRSQDHPLVSV